MVPDLYSLLPRLAPWRPSVQLHEEAMTSLDQQLVLVYATDLQALFPRLPARVPSLVASVPDLHSLLRGLAPWQPAVQLHEDMTVLFDQQLALVSATDLHSSVPHTAAWESPAIVVHSEEEEAAAEYEQYLASVYATVLHSRFPRLAALESSVVLIRKGRMASFDQPWT